MVQEGILAFNSHFFGGLAEGECCFDQQNVSIAGKYFFVTRNNGDCTNEYTRDRNK